MSLRPAFDPVFMVAQLVTDPFFKSFDEIADLTDFQILRVLYHPRDDKGALKAPALTAPEDDVPPTLEQKKAVFFGFGSAMGIPLEELTRTWQEKHPDGPSA